MKIRHKLVLVTSIYCLSVLGVSSLAVWTVAQISALKQTIDKGTLLIAESSTVRGLLHDLLFGMFAPETYTLLKDLTYAPRPYATPREWTAAAGKFRADFESFMALPRVKNLLRDSELKDKYKAALSVSETAFQKIDSLNAKLRKLEDAGIIGSTGLYQRLQAGDSPQVNGFFDDVRETSYYLTNNFESFLDYFLLSLHGETDLIQRQRIVTFIVLAFLIGISAVFITVAMGRRITRSISTVETTIRKVSGGDFSAHLDITSHDEFGRLSDNLNSFIQDLKRNVDSIIELHRNVGDAITDSLDLDSILKLVIDSAVKETNADSAAILLTDGEKGLAVRAEVGDFHWGGHDSTGPLLRLLNKASRSGEPLFIRDCANDPSLPSELRNILHSLVALPLIVSRTTVGALATVRHRRDRMLTDLDFISLSSFADYAALTIDNYYKYAELIERRQAEYMALQSQVHPHFLYNVLSGIVGLNRKGERPALERSVLSLRNMLRYTTEHQKWTTVSEELEFIDQYCALQKIRFGDKLTVTISCAPDAARYRIPKLILQPLVENAIIHGLEPLDRPGSLSVRAEVRNGDRPPALDVTIEDDGVGFEPGPIEKTKHIGLYNVRERLSLAYRHASFDIVSRPGKGTRISIEITGEEPLH